MSPDAETLLHLSDLHFGSENEALVDVLLSSLTELNPTVVVISGDFTLANRYREYEKAVAFLEALPCPSVVIPGNHDLHGTNLYKRFTDPLSRYKRYLSDERNPTFSSRYLAVIGIWSTRAWLWHRDWSNGRISRKQLMAVQSFCETQGPEPCRILTAHHPFFRIEGENRRPVGRHRLALEALDGCGVELVLSGHFHRAYYQVHDGLTSKVILAQIGTALSQRLRGEANSFASYRVDASHIEYTVHTCEADTYVPGDTHTFDRNQIRTPAHVNDG